MKTRFSTVADFYQQLALLIRSNLPLPDSLRQLGERLDDKEFSAVILQIGERSARGEKFSSTIEAFSPHLFPAFHVRLISAGETSGTLPDTLFAVAKLSRFQQFVVESVRDILAYPLFTIHLALIIALYISIRVIPAFHGMFEEILDGESLPAFSSLVMGAGMLVHNHMMVAIILYASCLLATLWVFSPGIAATRALAAILNAMPGASDMVSSMDSARLCNMCSIFLKQRMPLHEALDTAAQLVQRGSIREALKRTVQKLRAGTSVTDALSQEAAIDKLILMTFSSASEEALPDELVELAGLFEHRVVLSVKTTKTLWAIVGTLVMSAVVASVVMAMFSPLISIIRILGE